MNDQVKYGNQTFASTVKTIGLKDIETDSKTFKEFMESNMCIIEEDFRSSKLSLRTFTKIHLRKSPTWFH